MKSLLFTLGALIAFCGVALANQPEKESCVGSPNSVEMEACQWTKDVEYVVESVYDEDREETVYSFLVKNHRPYYVTLYVTVVQLQKEWKNKTPLDKMFCTLTINRLKVKKEKKHF